MNKILFIFFAAAGAVAALGQGKVSLQMDLPIIFGPTPKLADAGLANQPIPNNGPLPSGIVLEVGLFGGTSSTSLTLQGTAVLNPVGGNGLPNGFFPVTHVITSLPGGIPAYFQVEVWDSTYATPLAALFAGSYAAWNNIFTMTPGTSIFYVPINSGGGTTWSAVGNETPFVVFYLPEPSGLTLIALGVTLLAFHCRRLKRNVG